MKRRLQETRNTLLDLARVNSTHAKGCPRYHNRTQPLPDCDCFLAKRLEDAIREVDAAERMINQ